ncbi:hypothetical protein MCBMB27_02648 [Methylobacterium phyllosphaerae]|uniref:Uncharacterized protein n=1 Tax=Methylobacterium phyllosphaerae TaxID=418223 RepID=A0AAE8L6W7_9HYPH|nr:hypothetical protein [Methylobacterium phyllosphaerae]APT31939.1 hypothetical protein MCBMB27_02648 [Methylobacterium phyllosphaerae]SFH01215.1 hypothetical protein SAMN05192567_11219 [Methylobacterium phyllosphaerae]
MVHLLATFANGWAAFSLLATISGLGGIALIAAALVFGAYLPAGIRHALVGAGLGVLVGAALFQAGQARGAHNQLALDADRAIEAERVRRVAAEAVSSAIAEQATRDLAAEQADTAKLKGLLDDLRSHPDASGACLPRDLARRLRAL